MKFAIYSLCIAIIFYSCDDGSSTQSSVKDSTTVSVIDTTRVQDTVIFLKDSTIATTFADSLPTGAYQGMFPCKGCEGIQQTIIFNDDKSYKQEQLVWGKDAMPTTSEGIWQRKNGRIELSQNNKTAIILMKKKDTLFGVNINGVLVNDSSKYILTKRKLAANNSVWNKKRSQGIDFTGLGNEPFWTLEIDNEKFILFKLAGWKKPVIVPVEKPVINKDSTLYNLKTDTTKWTLTILPQFCNDGMSDYLYQYRVKVNYKGILYRGCGIMLNNKEGQ
ncbi:MAG: copper resistance protein NlpE N-terminal domain-containing protein [Ginsengibacter sp.]